MTESERRHWEERSAAFDDHATPEELTRRDAARQRKHDKAKREQERHDSSPPS
jgi:hypothetical protein